jgi:hypothetical protein
MGDQFSTSPEDQDPLWPRFIAYNEHDSHFVFNELTARDEWYGYWLFFKAGAKAQEAMRLND